MTEKPRLEQKPNGTQTYISERYKLWYDAENQVLRMKNFAALTAEDAEQVLPLVNKILADKPHRYMIVDLTSIPIQQMIDKESRQAFKEASDPQDLEKVAIFGSSPAMRMVAKIVLTVTGVAKITQFFKTEEQALAWIREGGE